MNTIGGLLSYLIGPKWPSRSPPIDRLNDDELFLVFKVLTLEELVIARQVCVRWRSLADCALARLKCVQFNRVLDLSLEPCCAVAALPTAADLRAATLVVNDTNRYRMAAIIGRCSALKAVNIVALNFSDQFTPIRSLIDNCVADIEHCNLAHIYVRHCDRNNDKLRISIKSQEMAEFVAKFPNIRHFSAHRSWLQFTPEALDHFFAGLPRLEFVAFAKETECVSETSSVIIGDYLKEINPNIHTIKITQNILGANGMCYLSERLINLQEFRVNSIAKLEDLFFICTRLKSLKCISFNFDISYHFNYEAFQYLSMLTELETIDIVMNDKQNEFVSREEFTLFMSTTKNMRDVIFRGRVDSVALMAIDTYWPLLEKLSIKPKTGSVITVNVIESIVKLKNLRDLDLRDSLLNDDCVRRVIEAPNQLRFLNLKGSRVTAATIDAAKQKAAQIPNEIFTIKADTAVKHKIRSMQFPSNFVLNH